jgi:hypothetical protein
MNKMQAAAVLSTDSKVRKGRNFLVIKTKGIDLSREVPMLDCHSLGNPPLGHLADVWISNVDDGLLMGTLVFDDTRAGRSAFAMVERGELNGVSCGFEFTDISIQDRDGVALDDETALKRQDDPNLIFCVRHSILNEISLCLQPVDPCAIVRACSIDAVYREMTKQVDETVQRLLHPESPSQHDGSLLRTIIPGRETILHGAPEQILRHRISDTRDDDDLRTIRSPRNDMIFYGDGKIL